MDPEQVPSEKITINGQEYDPADVAAKIDKANLVNEAETRYGISYDKVWPEYGRRGEVLKQTESERDQLRTQLETFQTKKDAGVETPADTREALEAARKLGLTVNEDIEKNYVKKDELDKYFADRETKAQAKATIEAQGKKFEAEMDGSDGRPKFRYSHVLAYGIQNGKNTLEEAYNEMYADELKAWNAEKIAEKAKPGLKTFQPGAQTKQPKQPSVKSDDDYKKSLKETLWGSQE